MSANTYGDTPAAFARDRGLVVPRRLAYWATRDPTRPFLVEVRGRKVTYGEAHEELLRWCELLRRLGVRPGDRVASFLAPSIDAHLLGMALSCVGALEVPVNPELPPDFLAHILTDASARLCFTRPADGGLPAASGVPELETVVVDRADSPLLGLPAVPLTRYPNPGDVACVIYTSGTTGLPKGVIVSWGQLSGSLGRIPRSWLSRADAVYSPWPMFHVTGRTPLVSMADVGGRVVLRERFSLGDFWDDIGRHGCTSTTAGVVASLLLAEDERADDALNPLRVVFMGSLGESALAIQRRFGVIAVGAYGSTEIGFPLVNRHPTPETAAVTGWLRPGYEARVVDERGDPATPGTEGELLVRPPTPELMMRGYLGKPDLTARAVVDGWYRTGDAFSAGSDGSFRFVSRLTDTIRRFAENISAGAIESVVLQDPEVLECAAVGVPSPLSGQEVLLAVVPKRNVVLDPSALYGRLRPRLARHMLPSYISVRDELPKTPNAKIRKHLLRDDVARPDIWQPPPRADGQARTG